jgi:hypothetical protein
MRATYSSEQARLMVAPFEDRPLHATVGFQIAAAGAREVHGAASRPDLDLFVFASRHDPRLTADFAARIVSEVNAGAGAAVADVDPKGDVQGASPAFTNALLAARIFPKLYGYASWNTAGNTLGTAIPQALLAWAGATLASRCTSPEWRALADAQVTFLVHRLVNDAAWQGELRPAINAELRAAGRSASWVQANAAAIAVRIQTLLEPRLASFASQFGPTAYLLPSPRPTDVAVQVGAPRDLRVQLPWGRTFEAAITFDVPVTALGGPGRRLPSCVASHP